jgi:phosphohistidine phosphatase
MKRLVFLRHAKSSWDSGAASDHDRPLAARGRRDAPLMGKAAKRAKLDLDLVVCSTATRARETLDLFAGASGYDG